MYINFILLFFRFNNIKHLIIFHPSKSQLSKICVISIGLPKDQCHVKYLSIIKLEFTDQTRKGRFRKRGINLNSKF